MQKRILGKTGEEVSILGFGAMRLPLVDPKNPESIDEDMAVAMARSAFDSGVNYIDTAYNYHGASAMMPGQSELFVGRILRDGYRGKVKVATKLPTWVVQNRKHMGEILDSQLERIGVEQIDFYLAHNFNHNTWPATRNMGILEFLAEAKKDGRVKHVGFSYHDNAELFEELLDVFDWSFVQIQYNYLDTDFQAGRRGLEAAAARGMGVVVMEPLRGGLLTQRMPLEYEEFLAGVHPGWSLADWGLRWVWDQPEVGIVLSGMSTIEQVKENVAIANDVGSLSRKEREALQEIRERFLSRIEVNCTGCGYCLPCPSGVNIPGVFNLYNDYNLVDSEANHNIASFSYNAYMGDQEVAGNCTSCGVCEPRCPQGIEMSKVMPEVAQHFGR